MALTAYARNIFSGQKFKMRSYMTVPSVYAGNSTVGTISVYPILYLSYDPSKTDQALLGNFRAKDAQFKVNPRNFKRVLTFFRTIYDWFNSDTYKDLFVIDDESGKMMVNMEYRDMHIMVNTTRYDAQALLALPTVIERDSIVTEGCAIAINQRRFACSFTDLEIESILGILENFSFQAEAQLLLTIGSNNALYTDHPAFDSRLHSGNSSHKVVW